LTGDVLLVLGAALASGVEMVEAATIVLALGMSRGWRAPLLGSAAALGVLAAATLAVGPALEQIPIDALRLVVGTLVLLFGLQWLRKAILREAGVLGKHDEDAAFAQEVARARETSRARGPLDRYSWTLAFKSVLLEGLEVVFIVLTLGVNQGSIPLAATGAAVAAVIVGATAVFVRRPLSRVPENALKFGVGVMLTAFGTFWAAEGAGAEWPAGDAALLALVAFTAAWSLLFVRVVRVRSAA
jgi:uncharacterized membrane protein